MTDELKIEPVLLERLLRYDAENKCARMALALEQTQWEISSLRHQQRMNSLYAESHAANKAFLSITATIEKTYNVDMKEYVFMPESGALTRVGDSQ